MTDRSHSPVAALALALAAASVTAAGAPARDYADFDRFVESELKRTSTPGAAIAIVSGDRVVHAKGYGVASVETGAAVTAETVFLVGSTTKLLTATLVLSLHDEGKLDLAGPIGAHDASLPARLSRVTPHQLLTHTAGMSDEVTNHGPLEEAALGRWAASLTDGVLFAEPGAILSYSNLGYDLLGHVVERAAKRPFADAMSTALLAPLGAKHSTFRITEAMTHPLAVGHVADPSGRVRVVRPFPYNAAQAPDGFLFSTAPDLARFAVALMNDGMLEGKRVLPASTLARLSQPHATLAGSDLRYGYGTTTRRHRGVTVVDASGAVGGFSCLLRMVPEHRFAVVVLANQEPLRLRGVVERAMESALSLDRLEEPVKPSPQPVTDEDLAAYRGTYANGAQRAELIAAGGKLVARFRGAELPVAKVGADRFAIELPLGGAPIEFTGVRGRDGRVEYIVVSARALRRVE